MSRSEREKGKVGEREVVNVFRAAGIGADRTAPLQAGCEGEADVRVAVPGLYLEVKRQERLNVPGWLRQIEEDCPEDREGLLVFRQSRQPWRVVVPLEWLASLLADGARPAPGLERPTPPE